MSTWTCIVYTTSGLRKSLQREAETLDLLHADLHRDGLILVDAKERTKVSLFNKQGKLSQKHILLFTQNLFILIDSGLSLKEALGHCKAGRLDKELRIFLMELNTKVEKGQAFSTALHSWKSSLGPLYLSLIKVGERSGNMHHVLARLVEYLQLRTTVREKVISSLMYPILVLTVAFFGITMLLLFIVPILLEIAASMNQVASNDFQAKVTGFQQTLILTLFALGFTGTMIVFLKSASVRVSKVKLHIHKIMWTSPIIKKSSHILNMLYFSFSMETLLSTGYSLESALQEAEETVGNMWFRESLTRTRNRIVSGISFAQALEMEPTMPLDLVNWVNIGERTTTMDSIFSQLRKYYQHELDKGSQRLLALIEPVLILAIGLVILSLIQTIITPLFGMMGSLL